MCEVELNLHGFVHFLASHLNLKWSKYHRSVALSRMSSTYVYFCVVRRFCQVRNIETSTNFEPEETNLPCPAVAQVICLGCLLMLYVQCHCFPFFTRCDFLKFMLFFFNEIVFVKREPLQRLFIICGCRVLSRHKGYQFCGGLSTFRSLRDFRVSFPQIQYKFYKHVNKWNVTTTNIKKQAI